MRPCIEYVFKLKYETVNPIRTAQCCAFAGTLHL